MSEDFHTLRRTGLGGSDIGAVLGLSPYRTPYQVWMEKTGRAEPFEGNLQMRFGTHAEDFVAREYSAQTGRSVQRLTAMLRHPEAPLIGHIDRLVIPEGLKRAAYKSEIRTDLGLECKTAHAMAASGDDWGEAGTDQIPMPYLLQCATYMALTGCPRWDLACLFGNSDFRIYHLSRDEELEAMLLDEASRWWRIHILADVPPDPSTETEARQCWAKHKPGKIVVLGEDETVMLREYARVKAEAKELEEKLTMMRDWMIPRFEDADELLGEDGKVLATYRANKDSQRTDWKELVHHHWPVPPAELVEQFTTIQPGARVLRVAKEIRQ